MVPKKSVSYSAAYKAFKTMLKFAGLPVGKFSLHSPRAGGTTDAFANGLPAHVIDKQGRWKSTNTKFRYLRQKEREVVAHLKNASSYC